MRPMKTILKRTFSGAALTLAFVAAIGPLSSLRRIVVERERLSQGDTGLDAFRWEPALVRFFAFSHLPVVVDGFLIRFVTRENQSQRSQLQGRSAGFFELNTASYLDPGYLEIYSLGANYLAVARNDAEGAKQILERGMEFQEKQRSLLSPVSASIQWPHLWHVPTVLAYIELFELQDPAAAARAFRKAAAAGDAPAYIRSIGEKMNSRSGIATLGLRLLDLQLSGARLSDEKRAELERRRSLVERLALLLTVEEVYLAWLDTGPGGRRETYADFLRTKAASNLKPEVHRFVERRVGANRAQLDLVLTDPELDALLASAADPWFNKFQSNILAVSRKKGSNEPSSD